MSSRGRVSRMGRHARLPIRHALPPSRSLLSPGAVRRGEFERGLLVESERERGEASRESSLCMYMYIYKANLIMRRSSDNAAVAGQGIAEQPAESRAELGVGAEFTGARIESLCVHCADATSSPQLTVN